MHSTDQLLDVLTRQGVLLTLSVRFWRATKKLNAEDLGLDPEQLSAELISLGHKKLLPKEALEPFALIESRAHRLVECSTFPFLNGLGRFLPNAKLPELMPRLQALAAEFTTAKQSFLDNYQTNRAHALEAWRAAARKLAIAPEHLLASIEDSFPPAARMEQHFGFATQLFQIRLPEALRLDLVSAGDQQHIQHARDEAARAAAADIQRGVQQFVTDCVASLRQQTAQLCDEMLQTIRTGKSGVHQKTLNRLSAFISEFKHLNFMDDQEMAAHLERVQSEFLSRTAEDYRDSQFARAQLQHGLEALAQTARTLATQDTKEIVERFGQMGQRRLNLVV